MGSFKKFTANVESDNNGIIKLVHSEKMQVRPLENDNYVIEVDSSKPQTDNKFS